MTASRLALLSFRDVVVSPYTELLYVWLGGAYHLGGPHWPDWSTQTAARHCHGGVPIDEEPPAVEATATLRGPDAWCGAITWSFGHQIADFSTRLLPTLAEAPDVRFAFSMDYRSIKQVRTSKMPVFFSAILDWYGIPRDRVDLITEPTLVERLVVAPQGEQYGGPGPEPWYLDLLDAHTKSRLGEIERSGSLYVSRVGQRAHFAGEAYLESALREVGFRVLRPKTVSLESLEEQLRAYAGAETVVFAEGSSVHTAQLMGRALGDVTVLSRRGGSTLAHYELQPRARSLRYFDAVRGVVRGLLINGEVWLDAGLTVLEPEKLLAALPIGDVWDQKAFEAVVNADVQEWLETEAASAHWAVFSPELADKTLRAAGLTHFTPV